MRLSNNNLMWAITVLAGLGLGCGQKTAATPHGSASAAAVKRVEIVDPFLKMTAYSWSIPSNWIFDGSVMPGTTCVSAPYPVFRMMSPDGITEMKLLPRFDWAWTILPKGPVAAAPDCLPLEKEMTASEVLQQMVGLLGVKFVREEPAEHLAEYQGNMKKLNEKSAASAVRGALPLVQSGDQARFVVSYNVNAIPMEEYLDATVGCADNPQPLIRGYAHFYSCSAWVSRSRARQGQLQAAKETMQAIAKSMAIDQQWNQKWTAIGMKKIDDAATQGGQAVLQMGADMARARQAQQGGWDQAQEMRQRQHEEFNESMRDRAERFDTALHASGEAKAKAASDWADYALDLQKRYDPATGQISKDSFVYTYSWVDEAGQHFQTNDVNENPNGRLKGSWVLQR